MSYPRNRDMSSHFVRSADFDATRKSNEKMVAITTSKILLGV